MLIFKDPAVFWLLLLLPVIFMIERARRRGSSFVFSSGELLSGKIGRAHV